MKDELGNVINIGDILESKWGYCVLVEMGEDNELQGKLCCKEEHSCKNIPYALNNGEGYIKISHNEVYYK